MADAGTMFRSLPTDQKLGDYNGVTEVAASTTFPSFCICCPNNGMNSSNIQRYFIFTPYLCKT